MEFSDEITGIVLAGGKSSRMGQDKGLTSLKNREMVSYAIDALKPVSKKIVIVSNNDLYAKFGYKILFDEFKNSGPAGGIHTGLKNSSTQLNIILSCDTPFVTSELIKFLLISRSKTLNPDVVVTQFKNKLNPLIGIYCKTAQKEFEINIKEGNLKIRSILDKLNTQILDVEENMPNFDKKTFSNINYPEDLTQISNEY